MRKRLVLIGLAFAVAACSGREEVVPEDRLVVEAWICSGEAPIVQLSTSIRPTREEQGSEALEEHIIRHARVTVSDGEREVSLTGMYKKGWLPPYIYTTGQLLGEAGKTYTLTVDTPSHHARAVTHIPEPVPLTGLEPERYGDTDTTWLLRARFRDRPGEHNCYKFFSKIRGVDSTYIPTRVSFVNDEILEQDAEAEVLVMPGTGLFHSMDTRPCYYGGERVSVRFCTMDPEASQLWEAFDSQVVTFLLPILTATTNMTGNVDGALGFFAGYGCAQYTVTLPISGRGASDFAKNP